MRLIEKEEFVCIDCETTGLDSCKDAIVEVGAIRFNMQHNIDQIESLIDPGIPIPQKASEITNITDEMLRGKPKIEEILPNLLKFIGDHIIIGHGVFFDIECLAKAAERANIPCTIRKNRFLDTLRMARLYGESPENSLEKLRMHFNIDHEGAHRAMNDVIVNVEVFKYLANRYRTVEKLFDTLSKPILLKIMPLGKYKGRLFKEIPLDYLLWISKKKLNFDQDLTYSIQSEIRKRKQGNLFSQATNPFADL